MQVVKFLPNIFTIFRLSSALIIVALYLLCGNFAFEAILPLYIVASITDYLDGKLARKYNVITNFGKCFDIIADKALVLSVLLIALDAKTVHIIFVFIILFREFSISGLREVLASQNITIPASKLGKWKTGLQMTACGFAVGKLAAWPMFVFNLFFPLSLIATYVNEITFTLFVIASVLTLLSGFVYVKQVFVKK